MGLMRGIARLNSISSSFFRRNGPFEVETEFENWKVEFGEEDALRIGGKV